MLLLSIKPDYAEAILDGLKCVEFRRRVPRQAEPGTDIAIYASSPTRALVGFATIAEFAEATPMALWSEYKNVGGIAYDDYRTYFSGTERAVGIVLTYARRLTHALKLDTLREWWPGFHPPQQFAYLCAKRQAELLQSKCDSVALYYRDGSSYAVVHSASHPCHYRARIERSECTFGLSIQERFPNLDAAMDCASAARKVPRLCSICGPALRKLRL
jgi:predicted transcriptional regulator